MFKRFTDKLKASLAKTKEKILGGVRAGIERLAGWVESG